MTLEKEIDIKITIKRLTIVIMVFVIGIWITQVGSILINSRKKRLLPLLPIAVGLTGFLLGGNKKSPPPPHPVPPPQQPAAQQQQAPTAQQNQQMQQQNDQLMQMQQQTNQQMMQMQEQMTKQPKGMCPCC